MNLHPARPSTPLAWLRLWLSALVLFSAVVSAGVVAQPLVAPPASGVDSPAQRDFVRSPDSLYQAPGVAVWSAAAGRRWRLDLQGSWTAIASPGNPHGLSLRTLPPASEVLYGRLGTSFTWEIGRRLELRLDAGAGAAMDQSGRSLLAFDIGVSLRWWFTDHWGIAVGPSLMWVPDSPTTARDIVAPGLSEGFENPTPWDDPRPAGNAWGEALRRTLMQIQLLHRP